MKERFVLAHFKAVTPLLETFHYYDCPDLFTRILTLSFMNILLDKESYGPLNLAIKRIVEEENPLTENSKSEIIEDGLELITLFWRYHRNTIISRYKGCVIEILDVSYRKQGLVMDIEVTY